MEFTRKQMQDFMKEREQIYLERREQIRQQCQALNIKQEELSTFTMKRPKGITTMLFDPMTGLGYCQIPKVSHFREAIYKKI